MKQLFLCLFIVFGITSCASNIETEPLICEKNCKQACLITNRDYKGFDEKIGCYCADR
jgi:hypothetical protein